ncbi:MAG: dihydroorotate dehydrogenase electron transfer subunit [Lachnospiraceae bacterium]|nr:dihydroorotate dehydrogenase electron transfer subunit [Lachnospiraceae bacterium]
MPEKKKITAVIRSQTRLAEGIYDMWLVTELAREAKSGQFVGVYPLDRSTLLPRPISICEVNEARNALRLVYRVAGAGTEEFSCWRPGQVVKVLGVLGNGYPVEEARGKCVALLGGGIGVPPLLETAKALSRGCLSETESQACDGDRNVLAANAAGGTANTSQVHSFLGYRDANLFLEEDFARYGTLHIATEDGSRGTKGNVLDALRGSGMKPDVIMACGPMPMLRAVKQYAEKEGIEAYISLEERMACGVGACLGCVVKTRDVDPHSHVHNARICTDGPVFNAKEVEI